MATDPNTLAQIAQLQGFIAALQAAIFSGATRVSFDGRSVDYDDLQSMKQRLSLAQSSLNALLNPGYRQPTAGYIHFKGYPRRPMFPGRGPFWGV